MCPGYLWCYVDPGEVLRKTDLVLVADVVSRGGEADLKASVIKLMSVLCSLDMIHLSPGRIQCCFVQGTGIRAWIVRISCATNLQW